jgi:hypothetical protein
MGSSHAMAEDPIDQGRLPIVTRGPRNVVDRPLEGSQSEDPIGHVAVTGRPAGVLVIVIDDAGLASRGAR